MLTEPCQVRDVAVGFFFFLNLKFLWALHVLSTPGKIGSCRKCFPCVNNLSNCRLIDLKVFRNSLLSLPRLMGRHRCFSKIMANIFPPLCCVNTHLNAWDQQTVRSSVYQTSFDYQLLAVTCPLDHHGSSQGIDHILYTASASWFSFVT